MRYFILLVAVLTIPVSSCKLSSISKKFNTKKGSSLSNAEIGEGLKEALKVGIKKAVRLLSKRNGYYGDASVKILFPKEVQKVEKKLRQIGMGYLVNKFVRAMNKGAERAATKAVRIFVNVIMDLSFEQAKKILFGADNAATVFLKNKTMQSLRSSFLPYIRTALRRVGAIKIWRNIITRYNKIPFVRKMNADIVDYTTKKALNGLFMKVEKAERKIRKSPAARVTKILKKVFKALD